MLPSSPSLTSNSASLMQVRVDIADPRLFQLTARRTPASHWRAE